MAALSQPSTTVNSPAWQKPMTKRRANQTATFWVAPNTRLMIEQAAARTAKARMWPTLRISRCAATQPARNPAP